jgi:hypothetical protein
MHRAGLRDAAQIVARQVDEHDVLGVFLGIGQQLFLQQAVVDGVATARSSARDRTHRCATARQLHQRFGRRADDGRVAELAEVHIRRGIQQPQRAIRLERLQLAQTREAHRQHQLIHIAGRDVFLHATHALDELCFGQAADGRRVLDLLVAGRDCPAQRLYHFPA